MRLDRKHAAKSMNDALWTGKGGYLIPVSTPQTDCESRLLCGIVYDRIQYACTSSQLEIETNRLAFCGTIYVRGKTS